MDITPRCASSVRIFTFILPVARGTNVFHFGYLEAGHTVTFLLRNLAVFDEEKNIQECVKSKKAFLVKGDAMIQEDVKRAWYTAAKAVPSGNVDLLVITVGKHRF